MPTPKQAISEALQSLDHQNDAHWTDDGAPLVSEVQRITNDKTLTRAQINEALPGFARKTSDSITEEVQPDDEASLIADAADALVEPVQAEADQEADEPNEHERLRKLAHRRVQDAEHAIMVAKDNVSKAMAEVVAAEQRHTRALAVYTAKYPPLTAAENIKQHLRRQAEVQRERIEGQRFVRNAAQNPVDATLMDRKRNNGRNGANQPAQSFLPRSLAVSG